MENLSSTNDNQVDDFRITISEESVGVTVVSRRIHRVPQQLRVHNKNQRVYGPVVVSLGPYHHGRPRLRVTEKFKHKILKTFLSESGKEETFFLNRILEKIDEIRNCYVGISKEKFTDTTLAKMMLCDACFIIYAMRDDKVNLTNHLGISSVAFMTGDFCMVENQIPLFVIRLLINLKYDGQVAGEQLLCTYLSCICFGDDRLSELPWKDKEPLHLLEAQRRILLQGDHELKQPRRPFRPRWLRWRRYKKGESSYTKLSLPFGSVTDLKSKGIHFRPSSNCLKDISFKSYSCYGQIKLPIWFVTNSSKVLFSNMIAYEMSPDTNTEFEVMSYVNFMKTLIESPKDAKQLRINGIIFSNVGSEEEVVKVFREIDTHGLNNEDIFHNVKMRIVQHCASKAKTWMIELFYAHFRTPWAVTAFLAASLLITLTFIQTYFTIHPASSGN